MRSRLLPVVVWIGLAAGATGIGLATVSAVRAAVADDPVRVLSAADVAVLLREPGADLDPIATLAAADSLPQGASGADEGQQVDSREAMAAEQTDRSDVPTNADDRPSRLGSDPGTLGSTGGGPARVPRDTGGRGGLVADDVESRDNPPTPTPTPTPTLAPTPTATPSPTPSQPTPSPSASQSPDASGGPSPEPSLSPSTSTSPVPSPTPPVATPSPTPSASVTPTAGPQRPRPTATANPTPPPPMYTLVPLSGFVAVWERLVPGR